MKGDKVKLKVVSRAVGRPADKVIDIRGLSLIFQTADAPVFALSKIDLSIAGGEFVSFIGPSGCGKTTLLRVIADLERPTEGTITVNGVTPERSSAAARLWLCLPGAGALSVAHGHPQHHAAARDHGA